MMIATRIAVPRFSARRKRQRGVLGVRPDCVRSNTASALYCLDFVSGEIKSAPARNAPESPERIGRTPGISSGLAVVAADPDCEPELAGAALAVSSGVVGVAA